MGTYTLTFARDLQLCLAATAALCQAARIPRGIDPFPNFHSVHHGYGATSYQNVQIESHGSVPVPAGDHDHDFERQDHVVVHHKEPHYALHDGAYAMRWITFPTKSGDKQMFFNLTNSIYSKVALAILRNTFS